MDDRDGEQRTASISFRQLDLFAEVGRCGSIVRAARLCDLSQPAASHALALLQDKVGVALLQRGVTGTALTPLGRLFHGRIERVLAAAAAAVADREVAGARAIVRRLTPTQLRTLAAVLQAGSLERAGQAMGLTHSAVRRSAGVIEQHLGPLFVRTPDGTLLTPEGEGFARRICALRQDVALGVREIQSGRAAAANTIVVGAAQAFGNRLLARVLAELGADHPDARITVLRESPAELVARLRAGEVDLVVGDVNDAGPDLVNERLVATPYFVFGRPGHPLSRPDAIHVAELARYDWVGGTPGSVRETVQDALFADASPPRVAFAASEGAVVGHFVAGSDRLALMTEHESRCGGLALAKLPFAAIESGLGIDVVRRAAPAPSLLHDELVELLRAHLAPATVIGIGERQRRTA